jgi:pyridoxine 5-phosphate synthase
MGTEPDLISGAADVGADRIELYTGPYADAYFQDPSAAVAPFSRAAAMAHECGLGVNAGHDLDLDNLAHFSRHVQPLAEVSIGHALISDALYFGLQNAVGQYKERLRPA